MSSRIAFAKLSDSCESFVLADARLRLVAITHAACRFNRNKLHKYIVALQPSPLDGVCIFLRIIRPEWVRSTVTGTFEGIEERKWYGAYCLDVKLRELTQLRQS